MRSVERARAADAADLLRLQEEAAQEGAVRLALVADTDPERTLVARDDRGTPIAMATWVEHELWVEGERANIAYLGGLRVAEAHRGDPRLVARGFRHLREALAERGHDWALTAILSDNEPARRLLERGARGFPTYRPLVELETSVLATSAFHLRRQGARADTAVSIASDPDLSTLTNFAERTNYSRQFAPTNLAPGLSAADLLVLREGDEVTACAALRDRSGEQRAVVRGYGPGLRALRPLANALAPLGGWPRLPRAGSALRTVYLSHLAVADDEPERFERLLRAALREARRRGFELLVLGFDRRHPLAGVPSRVLAPRTLASRLYAVHWGAGADIERGLGERIAAPEVALL